MHSARLRMHLASKHRHAQHTAARHASQHSPPAPCAHLHVAGLQPSRRHARADPAEPRLLLRVHAQQVAALPRLLVVDVHGGRQLRAGAHLVGDQLRKRLKAELLDQPDEARLLAVAARAVVPAGRRWRVR